MRTRTHKKGALLLMSNGSYSDYSVYAILKAKQDLDLGTLAAAYFAQAPMRAPDPPSFFNRMPSDPTSTACLDGFVAWLLANGYCVELPYEETNTDHWRSNKFVEQVEDECKHLRETLA